MRAILVRELLDEFKSKLPVGKEIDERVLVCDLRYKPIKEASGTLELDKIHRDDIKDLLKTNGKKNRSFNKNRNFFPKGQNNGVFINGCK